MSDTIVNVNALVPELYIQPSSGKKLHLGFCFNMVINFCKCSKVNDFRHMAFVLVEQPFPTGLCSFSFSFSFSNLINVWKKNIEFPSGFLFNSLFEAETIKTFCFSDQ